MNIYKILLLSLLVLFTFNGCQGNNSDSPVANSHDTNNSNIPVLPDANVTSLILPVSSSTLTLNRENLQIEVRVELNGAPLTTGSIKVLNPSSSARSDVGYFDSYDIVPNASGRAIFSYYAPENLDNNVSDIVFSFYHSSNTSTVSPYTVSLAPIPNQVELFNYFLRATPNTNLTLGLESSLSMSFSVVTETTILGDSDIVSIKIETLNPAVAKLRDTTNDGVQSITVLDKNSISVSIDSNTTSGIVPIKVTAIYRDGNGTIQSPIEKVFSLIVLSGPPTSISIDYKGTSHLNALFKDTMIVVIRDEYGNLVNTQTGVSTSVFSGYAVDTSGPLDYMYHASDESIAGTLSGSTFSLDSGVITEIDITNSGSGYTSSPTVSLAGGDGNFAADVLLSTRGSISNVNFITYGNGYIVPPTIEASGQGSGFLATVNLSSNGGFFSVDILNSGLGYITAPTITPVDIAGNGFSATVTLEDTGRLKDDITVTSGGTGYTAGEEIIVYGDGQDAVVRVLSVGAGGSITAVKVYNKGTGYKAGNTSLFYTKSDGNTSAVLSEVNIGYSIATVTIDNPGSGYSSDNLTISGSPDEEAILSGTLSYVLDSTNPITILSSGSGYNNPSLTITSVDGNGSGAYATPTVTYSVNRVDISNGGTNYSDGALVFNNAGTGGIGASANANIFPADAFTNVDDTNYKLALFGTGYVYDASGKWDITNDGILNQLSINDTFEGNTTKDLGFVVGNNQRDDLCIDSKKWGATANIVGGSEFSATGLVEVELEYNHYMVAKDIMLMVNLIGEQNSLGKTIKIGESTKHTLRGLGISVPSISISIGENYTKHRVYIKMDDTVEYLRNANFGFAYSATGKDVVVNSISTSMGQGIKSCEDSDNVNTEGTAYIDFFVSSGENSGSITVTNLIISSEF